MVALPIAVAIGLLADPLVRIALGAQWLAAIPVLKVLAIYGAINVCVANTWPVFIALGRPWVNTALTALGASCWCRFCFGAYATRASLARLGLWWWLQPFFSQATWALPLVYWLCRRASCCRGCGALLSLLWL